MSVENNPKIYFWMTFFGHFGFLTPVLMLFFLERGLSLGNIFWVTMLAIISKLIFEVPTGLFGDHFGRKRSLQLAIVCILFFQVGIFFAQSFLFFALLHILLGVALAFFSGSDEALIYDSLKQIKKTEMMHYYWGRIIAAKFLPIIVVAPLGGILAKDLLNWQFQLLIAMTFVFTFISFLLSFWLKEPTSHSHKQHLFSSGLKLLSKDSALLGLALNKILVFGMGVYFFAILWQPYLKELGIPVAFFGALVAFGGVGSYFFLRDTRILENLLSSRHLIFLTGFLTGIFLLGAAFIAAPFYGILFYIVVALFPWIREPFFSKLINKRIQSRNRATVISTLSVLDSITNGIILGVMGFFAFNLTLPFIIAGSIALLATIFFHWPSMYTKKRTRSRS